MNLINTRFDREGFVVIQDLLTAEQVSALNEEVDKVWAAPRKFGDPVVDINLGMSNERRTTLSQVPHSVRGTPYKLSDLYLQSELIRALALQEALCETLRSLFSGTPLICNTLNLERGSEQPLHVDSWYMTPKKRGKLLAVWFALEDANDEAGPLVVVPKSHKLQLSKNNADSLSCEAKLMAEQHCQRLLLKKGAAVIWHADLLHGGSAIRDTGKTRKSMVVHYFRVEDHLMGLWRLRRLHNLGWYYQRRKQKTDSIAADNNY